MKLNTDLLKSKLQAVFAWSKSNFMKWFAIAKDEYIAAGNSIRGFLLEKTPAVIERYDHLPNRAKQTIQVIPLIIIMIFALYLFGLFDPRPKEKFVQDPTIVMIEPRMKTMFETSTIQIEPFVEVLRVSGRIDFDEGKIAKIGATVTGRVADIEAQQGQYVQQGELLARITSTELTQSQLAYLKSKSANELASRAAERAQILYKEDVIALAEKQRRETEAASAKAEFKAANDQLRILGMSQKSIDNLGKSGSIESINNVLASISGEIVERKITKGQVVQPSDALFTVAHLDTLWVTAQVPESKASLLTQGQKAVIEIGSLKNQKMDATISFVASTVNPETRTVTVRTEIDNKNRILRPGMLATMLIDSAPVEYVVIPAEAVVREDNHDHVFVADGENKFRMVTVKLGPESKGVRPVVSGIQEGQIIVTKGAFHLNTERRKQLTGG